MDGANRPFKRAFRYYIMALEFGTETGAGYGEKNGFPLAQGNGIATGTAEGGKRRRTAYSQAALGKASVGKSLELSTARSSD